MLADRPLARKELGEALAPTFPEASAAELGFAARLIAPVVQTAQSVTWAKNQPTYMPFEAATRLRLDGDAAPAGGADIASSFAAAFGRTGPADFAYWSGTTQKTAWTCTADFVAGARAGSDPRRSYVLPEFDNLFFSAKNSIPFSPDDAKKRLIFGAARMKGCLVESGEIVAAWGRQKGGYGPTIEYWREPSRSTREEWDRFARWYDDPDG